ncbi:hypothetical protein CGMCC3_g6564 [Colletotrichum fructicola]|uniref:Kelch repeat protein n=1 Tax=Colletotrichum fructicola (strain Nara gc5) TaxID=1213859 RepID=L2G4K6_COLFN|nr:uncharacterized protein CGMCC3_g6564 [Colletotrichum fructicola]KAE9577418.1 hypothetical protein CGMCC3_g6564 [Colletotrichum fructicola]KAF4411884.1 Kelch repeat-containing protein [Colletotrichum fructicola]
MNSIPKDSQKLDGQSVWLGPSGNEFYTWVGEKFYNRTLPDKEIWRFTADGSGGGRWAKSPPSNLNTFEDLLRPTDGTFTQSKDTGYYFGGIVRRRSDSYISDWNVSIPTPGLVSYNMTSGEIKNTTSKFGQYGTFKEGSSQFLPFGDAGVLLFLGGQEAPITSREGGWEEIDFSQVTLFDIKGQKWYTQSTTGSKSARRRRFCTTGVLGPNNTFEIFIYGGWSSNQDVFSDVYVLSVPGFRFFKAGDSSTPRYDQACVVVGRRQMLSIGGLSTLDYIQRWTQPDPWPYGLGVFDLTEMRWKDGYSADEAAYESPEIVKQWYEGGGQNNVSWANEDVKLLFLKPSQDELPSPGPSATPDRNGTSNDGDESRSSSPPAGTIAGAVAGGFFGVALLIGLAIVFIKHKKSYAAAPRHPPHDPQATDSMYQKYGSQSTAYGEHNMLGHHQLHGESSPLEMDTSSGRVEVHGHSIPVELSAETIAIGKYVCIDGGEVSQYEGEYNETYSYPSWPVNSTISIGLTEPWDPASVTMKTTPKIRPYMLNGQAIWKDPTSNAFFTWGGWKGTSTPWDKKILRFTADDTGEGNWQDITPPNLLAIARTREGAFSQSKNVGYYFGGYTSQGTDADFDNGSQPSNSTLGNISVEGRPAPGLVYFDMRSGEMRNISSSRFGKYGTFKGGSLQFVPFGPEGLLVVLGGWEAPVSATRFSIWDAMAFDKISVYDPHGDEWYHQQTTGDVPFRKEKFCTTGAPGPNNTYEIFIYGGRETNTFATSNEVHILSLPGFNFFKADNKSLSTQRADHACTVIGGRQMLSVGGLLPETFIGKRFSTPDPWPLGLGIFDMTELRWTNRYDPNAGGYDSPKVVKDWYSQGNVANWVSPELKALFSQWSPNATASEVGLPGDTEPQPSGPNIGAIVGGAVGGVAALVLVAGLVLFFRRRRKRQVAAAPQDSSPSSKFGSVGTAYTAPTFTEIDEAGSNNLSELPGNHGVPTFTETHEADSNNLLELPANYGVPAGSHGPLSRHEMAA